MGGGSCGGLDDGLEIAFEPVHGREPPSGGRQTGRHSNGEPGVKVFYFGPFGPFGRAACSEPNLASRFATRTVSKRFLLPVCPTVSRA